MPLRKELVDFATRLAALKKSSPAFRSDPDLGLPMDEASRALRANEFYPIKAFRGEGKPLVGGEFIIGHPDRKDAGWLGSQALYASNAPSVANFYASAKAAPGGGQNVMPLRLSLHNPKVIDMFEKERLRFAPQEQRDAWFQEQLEAGHDGVLVRYAHRLDKSPDSPFVEEYAVPSASQARSIFARFDPDKLDSSDLGAAVAGASLIPALMPTSAEAATGEPAMSPEELERAIILNQDRYTPRIRSEGGLSPLRAESLRVEAERNRLRDAYREAADPSVGFGSMRESDVPLVAGTALGAAAPLRVATMPRAMNALSGLARLLLRDTEETLKAPRISDPEGVAEQHKETQAGLQWARDQLGFAEGGQASEDSERQSGPEQDPRYLNSLLRRGMTLNDIYNNYSRASANVGDTNAFVQSASGPTAFGEYLDSQRIGFGAGIPVTEGVSLSPSLFALRDNTGTTQYQGVTPTLGTAVGPFNASIGKDYGRFTGRFDGEDVKEKSRGLVYGAGATIPIDEAILSYNLNKPERQSTMHTIGVRAPVLGGDLFAEADLERANRLRAALIRYNLKFAEGGAVNLAEGGNPDPYANPWWRGLPAPIQPLSSSDVMPVAALSARDTAGGTSPSNATIGGIAGAAAGALPSMTSATIGKIAGTLATPMLGVPGLGLLGYALGTAKDVRDAENELASLGFSDELSFLSALNPFGSTALSQAKEAIGPVAPGDDATEAAIARMGGSRSVDQTAFDRSLADFQAMGSPGLEGYGNLATPHSYGFAPNGDLISGWTGDPSRDAKTAAEQALSLGYTPDPSPGLFSPPDTTTTDAPSTSEPGPGEPGGDGPWQRGGQVSFADGGQADFDPEIDPAILSQDMADAEREAQIEAMTHRPLQVEPRVRLGGNFARNVAGLGSDLGAAADVVFPLNPQKMLFGNWLPPVAQEVLDVGSLAREPLGRIYRGEGEWHDPVMAAAGLVAGPASFAPFGGGPVASSLRAMVPAASAEASRLAPRLAPFAAPAAAGVALAPGEAQSAVLPAPPFSNLLWNLRHGLGLKGETRAQLPSYWQQRFKNPMPSFEVEGVRFKSPREEEEVLRQYLDIMARGPEAGTPITKEELAAQLEAQAIPSLRTKHLGYGRSFADEPAHDVEGRILPGESKSGSGEEILSQWDAPMRPAVAEKQLNFPSIDHFNLESSLAPFSDRLGIDLSKYADGASVTPLDFADGSHYSRALDIKAIIKHAVEQDGSLTLAEIRPMLRAIDEDVDTRLAFEKASTEPLYRAPEVHYPGVLGENLFAHSRSTARQNTAGEWGRLIDEDQSDIHQAALKQGYAPSFLDDLEHAALSKRRIAAAEGNAAPLTEAEEARRLQLEANIDATADQAARAEAGEKVKPRLPDAPLKKDWQQYQLKQEIARAIERGDSYVALTPGRVQADRWSLQKQISQIEWDPSTGQIRFYDPDGDLMTGDRLPKEIKEGDLASYIGKETAQKLIAATPDMAAADAAFKAHPWYEGLPAEYKRPLEELGNDRRLAVEHAWDERKRLSREAQDRASDFLAPERKELVRAITEARDKYLRIDEAARAEYFRGINETKDARRHLTEAENNKWHDDHTEKFNNASRAAAKEYNDIFKPLNDRLGAIIAQARKIHDDEVKSIYSDHESLIRLLAPKTNTIEGRQLRVGGAGSRKAYDRDMPKSMESIARQYGGDPKATVEMMKIPTDRTIDIDRYSGIWDSDKAFPGAHNVGKFIRALDSAWVREDDMAKILPKLEELEKMGTRLDDEKLVGQLLDTPQGEEAVALLRSFNKARAEFGREIAALDEKYKFTTGIELEVPAIRITDKMRDAYNRVKAKTGSGFSRYAVPPVTTLPFFERLYGEQPQEEFNAP